MSSKIKNKKIVLLIFAFTILGGCSSENQQASLLGVQETESMEAEIENVKIVKSTLCTDHPFINPLGREIYPVEQRYQKLEYLGPLFTAYSCSPERLEQLPGVEEGMYTLGSSILLKKEPTKNLLSTFKALEFKCIEDLAEEKCKKWVLEKPVSTQSMMQLQPYHNEFEADNCRNCSD